MGELRGAVGRRKFGTNSGVSTVEVEVRSEDANLAYQTSAVALEALSDDANDDGTSSGTLTLVSAVAVTPATGTVTIASPVANTFAFGTVTCVSAIVGNTVTVNGLLYTAVSGTPAEDEFDIDTGDTETATSLAAQITADTRSGTSGDQTATSSLGVVTITTDVLGTGGNAITLVSSDGTTLAVTGAGFLTGGVTADIVTANGLIYTAVVGARGDDTQFSIDSTDTATATDLAAAITGDTRSGTLNDITAIGASAVVTCTQTVGGVGGNATTLTSSDAGRLLTSGAVFTGGLDADVATVNGLTYTGVAGVKANNTQFSIDTSDTLAAADLADSINNDTRPPITVPTADVVAISAVGVVTIDQAGEIGDLVDIAGTANITASGATLTDVGTGARTIIVEGLDANFLEQQETVFLNGVTPVALQNTYIRVNRAFVVLVGSTGVNEGLITVRVVSGAVVQITIPADEGQSQAANFTVAANKNISIKQIDYSVGSASNQTVVVALKFWIREFGKSWKVQIPKSLTNTPDHTPFNSDEFECPAKTDMKITALKLTGTGDAIVEASYSYRSWKVDI